ncbi:DUF899 domain-containing protein [Micromonospora echinofusca]|uniref:DUF899 domain-containing protein n=1 Tax=Micromonospora echinofusca TaxID=47858 RepID=UPI000C709B03|nr:DUF899 domain-containing protein [Micromonospora sp. MSM11]MCL7456322.1 DUF899 domain-containing protein [Micromonospora sp. MSM11]
MTDTRIVGRADWLAARRAFLEREKEVTRARDALSAQRRALPMMVVDKEYVFEGPDGERTLPELFDGRRQLLTYHFMWPLEGHDWCPVCSLFIDNIGHLAHLHARDTSLVIVCAAPQSDIVPFKRRMGWDIPWYTTRGDDFYQDFTLDVGSGEPELPGISAFLRADDGGVLYAYSTHGRGSDVLNNTYNYLDLTPLGRQEEGMADTMGWIRHHDSYGDATAGSCHD